ncbi:MAG: SH3 domain-containing protein [Treponema sp.]|nr:SH3 domain-containing protein [Treponema sp.]
MLKRFFMAIIMSALVAAAFAAGNTRYISVQSLALKEKASNSSKTVKTLSYGDEVTVAQVSGKWSLVSPVSSPSVKGWVSSSSLSKRKIVAGKAVTTDASEISLAGKGFSEGIESEYRKDGKADYASVDLVEGNVVSDGERQQFVRDGKLKEDAE